MIANFIFLFSVIFANAFVTAAEIAIISLNDAKIRRDAEEGDRRAKLLCRCIDDPGCFLATLQVSSTIASFIASAFAAVAYATPLARFIAVKYSLDLGATENIVALIVTLLLAFVSIIIGELVPKRIAIKHSEGIAKFSARPVLLAAKILHPIVSILNHIANSVLRLIGVSTETEKESASEEEIRLMADIAEESGAIAPLEKEMIENVFEFNNKTADEIMVHRKDLIALPVNATHEEIRELIIGSAVSRIPVYLETIDDIIGIINARDYLIAALAGKENGLDALMRKPLFVPETIHADKLFHKMQKMKRSIAVVLDEHGGTSGIVTVEDLLEEIVGEMYDERDADTDTAPIEIVKISDLEFRMPGEIGIEEVSEELEIKIEEGDFNTIGGYIFEKLNSVPSEGTVLEDPDTGLTFRVEKMDGHRIESLIIRKPPPSSVEDESEL